MHKPNQLHLLEGVSQLLVQMGAVPLPLSQAQSREGVPPV